MFGLNDSVFVLLFLTGLVGSAGHCLGMCGPLVLMVGLRLKAADKPALPRHFLYHGARISVYAVLGVLAGLLGSFATSLKSFSAFGGAISLILGLGVLVLGLVYLGWIRTIRSSDLRNHLKNAMSRALSRTDILGVTALGALSGLLPCGLVYGSLIAAVSTGNPVSASLAMLLFGAGTMPALLFAGLSTGFVGLRARATLTKLAGAMMLIVAGQLVIRGLAELGLAPHMQFGSVMLW